MKKYDKKDYINLAILIIFFLVFITILILCTKNSIYFKTFDWMSMKPENNFSFFFWVKGTTTGWLFAVGGWEFRFTPSYILISISTNGQYPTRYDGTFDTNTWYHLGFTWSGSSGKLSLYLNGAKVAESTVPSSVSYDVYSTLYLVYDTTNECVNFVFQ